MAEAERTSIIGPDELEDFYASIEDLGYAKDEFELTEKPDPLLVTAPGGPLTGSITVKRKGTKAVRTYVAGSNSSWPETFHNELEQGLFGKA
jgi:hypothetical protein